MLSSLLAKPPHHSAVFTPSSPPASPPSKKCGFDGLIDTNLKIIETIDDLIRKYNECNNECNLKECVKKYEMLITVLKLSYRDTNFVNRHTKSELKDYFVFDKDTDSHLYVFEKFLMFLENDFQSQDTKNKIKYLEILKKIILNPEKKGGKRKSRRKQRKNKSKSRRYRK
jgi:hypothetical protein